MRKRNARGFTLIELVTVIVILGGLAAVAVPRYIDLGTQARLAAVQSAYGSVVTASNLANFKCKLADGCNTYGRGAVIPGPDGQMAALFNGYLTGHTRPTDFWGIKDWVQLGDFTAIELGNSATDFTKDGAPDPSNCKVTFNEAPYLGALPVIVMTTSGC